MSLIFQETLENKPYLILNISSDPLIRYAWSRLARASSSSRWRRSFSWRRRSFSWRSCSTWARSCCNSSRTEKGTDTGSNTLIDAIAASSLHIRLDSYSASPRRKRQGSANQIPSRLATVIPLGLMPRGRHTMPSLHLHHTQHSQRQCHQPHQPSDLRIGLHKIRPYPQWVVLQQVEVPFQAPTTAIRQHRRQ